MTAPVTKPAFAHKLPPKKPTLLDRYELARKRQLEATRAATRGGEYALEEMQANDAEQAFWYALQAETGVTRKMVEALL